MLTAEEINERGAGFLPGLLGIEVLEVGRGFLESRLEVRPELLAPNGPLHAATVVALADTSCGWGTLANLPDGGEGFATIELNSNFLGTAREGSIRCEATLAHGGRSTQVWDATVSEEGSAKPLALFRCTQMILHPRPASGGGGRGEQGSPTPV